MIKVIAGISAVLALMAAFYAGYYKRGEVEAVKTTEAYEIAIQEKSKEWQSKLELAVESARKEAMSRAKGKVIIKKVKVYVKENPNNRICYDANQLQLATESLRDTRDRAAQ